MIRKTLVVVGAPLVAYGLLIVYESMGPSVVTHEVRLTAPSNQAAVEKGTGWDHEQAFEVTGRHVPGGGGENCREVNRQLTAGEARLEGDTQVIYQDEDTHWDFVVLSNKHIRWRACANNCTFSCDTLKLHLRSKVVQ